MKNEKQWLFIIIPAVLILAVVTVVLINRFGPKPAQDVTEVSATAGTSAQNTEPEQKPETSPETAPAGTEEEPAPETRPAETSAQTAEKPETAPEGNNRPAYHDNQPAVRGLGFPCMIPHTSIRIDAVKSYDGIYLEDGSDEEIENVPAVILTNTGDTCIEYAEIVLTGEEETYAFKITGFSAGSTLVAMEKERKPFRDQIYVSAEAETAETEEFSLREDQIQIEELENGKLKITNISSRDIPSLRIFYKFHMPEENVYVGGITYTAKIQDLKAGTSREIMTTHFASGSSQVVRVETYETEEG